MNMLTYQEIKNIVSHWNIAIKSIRFDIPVSGSSQRTIKRVVVEDHQNRLFLLEMINQIQLKRKTKIIHTLNTLHKASIPKISRYLQAKNGSYIVSYSHHLWQLKPFIKGIELPRPAYIYDKWRGQELADFLIILNQKIELELFENVTVFHLQRYLQGLIKHFMENCRYSSVYPVCKMMKNDFLPVISKLRQNFVHGDYHPLNIIWGANTIKTIIDWEFTGKQIEAYDAANLVGCVGFENPKGLSAPLVLTFIDRLRKQSIWERKSWEYFAETVIASRFSWLALWMIKKDSKMIEMEKEYMNIIYDNISVLKNKWEIID